MMTKLHVVHTCINNHVQLHVVLRKSIIIAYTYNCMCITVTTPVETNYLMF